MSFFGKNSLKPTSFTIKYIFALTILGSLSILAYVNLTTLIEQQVNDSKVINLSGKQRMLSQKIYNATFLYNLDELKADILAMEKAHDFLISLEMSKEIKDIYYSKPYLHDKKVKEFILKARNIKKNTLDDNFHYIIENKTKLLNTFDMLTSLYQQESEQKIKRLKEYEQYILICSLLVLLLVGLFIFRPANRAFEKRAKEIIAQKDYSNIIIESNTNAIIAVGSDFKVKTFNKTAERIFGYTKEEMIGKNSLLKLVPSLYHEAHKKGISKHFQTGIFKHDGDNLELEALRKNGETFPIRISFGRNESNNGEEKIVIANIRDVSREKSRDKLIFQQSKMAAMGEMIENIAYQWKQPLSLILTASSGIKFKNEMNVIQENDIEIAMDGISNSVEHLSKTIDNFRDFFKTNKTKKNFILKNTFEKTFRLVEAELKNTNIELITNIDDISLSGYEHELMQVFINLLNNIKTKFHEIENSTKLILIDAKVNNSILEIFIKDNAGNLPKDIIDEIFISCLIPQKDSNEIGTGLYMSKMIMEEHLKGSIEVENIAFKHEQRTYDGVKFKICLPLNEVL